MTTDAIDPHNQRPMTFGELLAAYEKLQQKLFNTNRQWHEQQAEIVRLKEEIKHRKLNHREGQS